MTTITSRRNITSFKLVIFIALYFAAIINFPLYINTYAALKQTHSPLIAGLQLIPLFLFILSLFISLFLILSIKYIEKIIYIGLVLISTILSYAHTYYGIIFNGQSPLINTILQSNIAEIRPLITPSFLIWFGLLGIVPAYLIYNVTIIHPKMLREMGLKLLGLCLYPVMYYATAIPSRPTYHAILCETGLAARTPFQLAPTNFLESVFNYYKSRLFVYIPYQHIGLDAKHTNTSTNGKNNLLVFVIGESARSKNLQWYGYPRETNPYTKNQKLLIFQKMRSCGTSTQVSVPCLFSDLPQKKFLTLFADHRDNVLHILKRAKLQVGWIENNGAGGCQGVCTPADSVIIHDVDDAVVPLLSQQIQQLPKKDAVIVIHIHGSHGPDYYTMYPQAFTTFKPSCRKDDLRFCSKQALINSYDNSLRYTDFVLNEVINVLQKNNNAWNTALIYTSDHGESLGEHGIYEHCTPYVIAPSEQTNVPLILWLSDNFIQEKNISYSCLEQQAAHLSYSHDYLFHTLLGIMDITTEAYQPSLDLFKSCRQQSG